MRVEPHFDLWPILWVVSWVNKVLPFFSGSLPVRVFGIDDNSGLGVTGYD